MRIQRLISLCGPCYFSLCVCKSYTITLLGYIQVNRVTRRRVYAPWSFFFPFYCCAIHPLGETVGGSTAGRARHAADDDEPTLITWIRIVLPYKRKLREGGSITQRAKKTKRGYVYPMRIRKWTEQWAQGEDEGAGNFLFSRVCVCVRSVLSSFYYVSFVIDVHWPALITASRLALVWHPPPSAYGRIEPGVRNDVWRAIVTARKVTQYSPVLVLLLGVYCRHWCYASFCFCCCCDMHLYGA